MGIVAKQTLSNSAILFFGALLGAINVMLLYPLILPDQEIGLTRILISFTVLFSQLASLGGGAMLMKFIPVYNNGRGSYKGAANFIFLIGVFGFFALCICLLYTSPSPRD